MAEKISCVYEDVEIKVVNESFVVYLEIDGEIMSEYKGLMLPKGTRPVLRVVGYPFKSGAKDIDVYGKQNIWEPKYKLLIDNEFVDGEHF